METRKTMNATIRHTAMTTAALVLWATPLFASVPADSAGTRTIKGGEEGAVLESITVEGEDRVRVEFERPPLRIDVDPETAPGLEWDSMGSVLDRHYLDLLDPLIARSAFDRTDRIARPWLDTFRQGSVARFSPRLDKVERWTLAIADSRGHDVRAFSGKGKPPKTIEWDGLDADGNPVAPGLTYSYSVEASDEAGNTRNFVGDGFEIRPYTVSTGASTILMFSVASLYEDGTLLEAASRINQLDDAGLPVIVEVTAPSFSRANAVASEVTDALRPMLLGDPSRLSATARVEQRESEHGSIAIRVGR
jgi:hypothetical protein